MSSTRRIGLPETLRMRHDTHFVDQLGRPGGEPVGRMIPIEDIEPNPHQPRQAHRRPLRADRVDPREGRARADPRAAARQPVPDHRGRAALSAPRSRRGSPRSRASCARRSDAETMEIALIENLQRKDLSAVRRGGRPEDAGRDATATRTRRWPRSSARAARRSPRSLVADARCPRKSGSSVGWPTFTSKSLLLQIVRQGDPQENGRARSSACSRKARRTREDARGSRSEGKAQGGEGPAAALRLPLSAAGEELRARAAVPEERRCRARRSCARCRRSSRS